MRSLKQYLYETVEGTNKVHGRFFAWFIIVLILSNVVAAILETLPDLSAPWSNIFAYHEVFSIVIFTLEYLIRLWVCTLNPAYSSLLNGRIKYALTPLALVDLAAILPFYFPMILPMDLRALRMLRLLRILRMFKLARYSEAVTVILRVLRAKQGELLLVVFVCAITVVLASTVLFYVEHDAQPGVFSSIPQALWWGVATLTTVGYGDIYPITPLGKIISALFSLVGIALFALPAGILAGGFAEQIRHKSAPRDKCPHCGKELSRQRVPVDRVAD